MAPTSAPNSSTAARKARLLCKLRPQCLHDTRARRARSLTRRPAQGGGGGPFRSPAGRQDASAVPGRHRDAGVYRSPGRRDRIREVLQRLWPRLHCHIVLRREVVCLRPPGYRRHGRPHREHRRPDHEVHPGAAGPRPRFRAHHRPAPGRHDQRPQLRGDGPPRRRRRAHVLLPGPARPGHQPHDDQQPARREVPAQQLQPPALRRCAGARDRHARRHVHAGEALEAHGRGVRRIVEPG